MEPDQIQILELMAKNEEVLSELYKLYAKKYSEFEEFWVNISNDEISHADWIRGLIKQINFGGVFFAPGRFNQEMAFAFLKHAQEEIAKEVNSSARPIIEVLTLSLAIEKSFLEKDFFKVAETDQLAVKETLLKLAKATEIHIQKIEDLLKRLKD